MAPEVQGHGYGLSADLWSAGCLFYTMVTGKAPFRGPNVGDTLAKARAGRYVEPKGLSAMAKDFLSSMLSLVRNNERFCHVIICTQDTGDKGVHLGRGVF